MIGPVTSPVVIAEHHRITRVAGINRDADSDWLFARLEEVALHLNNEVVPLQALWAGERPVIQHL